MQMHNWTATHRSQNYLGVARRFTGSCGETRLTYPRTLSAGYAFDEDRLSAAVAQA
jgi:hypothetical protein